MENIFSNSSDVTLVITSCGRFDLLQRTLESFVKYNTYPIKEIIITEDSGNNDVYNYIPESLKKNTDIIINSPKLGQIKSIDFAYSKIKTAYVFHCEDDWQFYRPGFIEESLKVMNSDSKILQVWLRSFEHDIAIHSPYHFIEERKLLDNIAYYRIESKKKDWQAFSFNPGVKRIVDYKKIGDYSHFSSEKEISKRYAELDYYAVILENDAVMHTGFDSHVVSNRESVKKRKKKQRNILKLFAVFIFGVLLGCIIK